MYVKCALTILLALTIKSTHSVIADNGKFDIVKPSPIDELPDERRLTNFKERNDEDNEKARAKSEKLDSEKIKDSIRQEKKTRNILTSTAESADNPNCCGSRYEVSSPSRKESGKLSSLRASSEGERYIPRYGNRPEDRNNDFRFGWQSYNPPSPGRRGTVGSSSGGGLYGGQGGQESQGGQSGGDRYGSRPSYYGGGSDYDRPNNAGNRPGRPSYGYGGNGYSDNGAYGSNGYEINRPGSGYGNRPPGGINFGGGRPPGGTYGGGHGVYGTIGEDDEFPGQDDAGPDGGPPHPGVHNLQTQKAVALKALAGVALIGAAAALATNPVLLPIGVLAGRKKRSMNFSLSRIDDVDVDNLMKLLEDHVPKIYRKKISGEVLDSPTCVARLTCEIQQEYKIDGNNNAEDKNVIYVYQILNKHLVNLIQSKLRSSGVRYKNIKKLIKSADAYTGNCNVFVCDFTKN